MNKKLWYLLGGIVVVLAIIYFFNQNKQPNQTPPVVINTIPVSIASIPGWNTCDFPSFGFKFQYPKNWVVSAISAAQGGGDRGPIIITCGKINPQSLLNPISLGPSTNNGYAGVVGMTISTEDIRDKTGNPTTARQQFITSGTATFGGHVYSVSFGKNTDATTKNNILQTFEFVSQ